MIPIKSKLDAMRIWLMIGIFFATLCLPAATLPGGPEKIAVGDFSAAAAESNLPDGWEPLTFRKIERHTDYRLVRVDGRIAVKAESDNSASGLIRKIRIDPQQHPVLSWEWKVANVLEKGDASSKQGDDFPARIYVTFEYDPEKLGFWEKTKYEAARIFYGDYPPLNALTYVWGNVSEQGSVIPNAYSPRSMMIVVESGEARLNQWVRHRRNILQDYKSAFGELPPMISGVAIMTDTDGTGESAVAYYGDILFSKAED